MSRIANNGKTFLEEIGAKKIEFQLSKHGPWIDGVLLPSGSILTPPISIWNKNNVYAIRPKEGKEVAGE